MSSWTDELVLTLTTRIPELFFKGRSSQERLQRQNRDEDVCFNPCDRGNEMVKIVKPSFGIDCLLIAHVALS
ncbi:uncharacterized protein EAE97_010819 [Botrytis byssoidea]|uniref:Uncharacterized protein n=1 Tax=Botrytis byssoidea TaxID=139641 RepID=A0A9P5I0N6_9HELO|nr:uncharacterized protein EAE97_010819 [Botrytis byssoidea]KAF7923381.1 hypothetical protein EAE97_010819 [Botrytis byssoidea]